MRVLCDVSLLGYCGNDPAKITGMPRSLLEIGARLPAMAADVGDEVTFCACEWPERTYAFLHRHPAFAGARLLAPTNTTVSPTPDDEILDPAAVADADVFHSTHSPVPHGVRRQGTRRPAVVQTVWDMIPFRRPELFRSEDVDYYAEVVRRLRPEEDTVITISESAKRDFCDHTGFAPVRVHVAPLAADPARFHPLDTDAGANAATLRRVRGRYGLPPEAPYLLSVSTFEPRKNLAHVIRSFVRLATAPEPDAADDLCLVLAGGQGWKFEGILAELGATTPEVRQRIVTTGYVDDADLPALYAGALAFVYVPLLEGFGLPPLEAMRCGTPVIVSNTSSLPEVVGDAGVLLAPDDADGLCQAMLDLYRRPDRRATLAARALAQARRFSWECCVRATLVAYRAALAGKH